MIPVDFEGSNKVYGKPAGMTDEECGSLHVLEVPEQNLIISCWMPNKEDIEAINEGRPIWLKLFCNVQVPVEIMTLDKNNQSNNQ